MGKGMLKLTVIMASGTNREVAAPVTPANIQGIIHSTLTNAGDIAGYELHISIEDEEWVKYLKTDMHTVTEIHEKMEFRSPVPDYVLAEYITSRYNV